jgi:ABC-type nitrate/sulfonate/bicarbonate transport system substrate-binding protein
MKRIIVALDRPPDTHLTGLLLSICNHSLEENGIKVELQYSEMGHFFDSSAMKVATRQAHIGLTTPHHLLYFHTHKNPIFPLAVSAPVQKNYFAYAVKKDSTIKGLQDFSGKRFAAKGSINQVEELRYFLNKEDRCDMIQIENSCGLDSLRKNKADIAYINKAWDGIVADRMELSLSYFNRSEDELILGYDQVYIALPEIIEKYEDELKIFFYCLDQAYCFASKNPEKAAQLLHSHFSQEYPHFDDYELLLTSMKLLAKDFVDSKDRWGWMEDNIWKEYLLGLKRIKKTCREDILPQINCDYSSHIFTNNLLPYDF